jgi:hypothetical protein
MTVANGSDRSRLQSQPGFTRATEGVTFLGVEWFHFEPIEHVGRLHCGADDQPERRINDG